jgi:hypothetical protein
VALEYWKNSEEKDKNLFMSLAWVNFESYENWNTIYRSQKKEICTNYINHLYNNNIIKDNNFSFLIPIKNYIDKNKKTLNSKEEIVKFIFKQIWTSYKVLFKIK